MNNTILWRKLNISVENEDFKSQEGFNTLNKPGAVTDLLNKVE